MTGTISSVGKQVQGVEVSLQESWGSVLSTSWNGGNSPKLAGQRRDPELGWFMIEGLALNLCFGWNLLVIVQKFEWCGCLILKFSWVEFPCCFVSWMWAGQATALLDVLKHVSRNMPPCFRVPVKPWEVFLLDSMTGHIPVKIESWNHPIFHSLVRFEVGFQNVWYGAEQKKKPRNFVEFLLTFGEWRVCIHFNSCLFCEHTCHEMVNRIKILDLGGLLFEDLSWQLRNSATCDFLQPRLWKATPRTGRKQRQGGAVMCGLGCFKFPSFCSNMRVFTANLPSPKCLWKKCHASPKPTLSK